MRSLLILPSRLGELVYGPEEVAAIREMTDLASAPLTRFDVEQDPGLLRDVDVIFGTWGMPVLTPELLEPASSLKAIFYAAGTVKSFVTDAMWEREIVVSSAAQANAIPVAEYCLAVILFSLKRGWRQCRRQWMEKRWHQEPNLPGGFRTKVGLVSFGAVARATRKLLDNFDVDVAVYCPQLTEAGAAAAGVRKVTLEKIFRESDVVSLHTPELPETRGLIRGAHFRAMKQDATFINTARGKVVREAEMLEALMERTDLTAVLDVTEGEPPEPASQIFHLPNVFLTPHIAGALGDERRRLGQFAIAECARYRRGQMLEGEIRRQDLAHIA